MNTMAEGELHDGGSTSFTLAFLPVWKRALPSARRIRCFFGVRVSGWIVAEMDVSHARISLRMDMNSSGACGDLIGIA